VDKKDSPNSAKTGTNGENVHTSIDSSWDLPAFQADDEGSIPFTRSNLFNHLGHVSNSRFKSGLQAKLRLFTPFRSLGASCGGRAVDTAMPPPGFADGSSSALERFKVLDQPLGKDRSRNRQAPASQLSKHKIGARKITVVNLTCHQAAIAIDRRADLDLKRNRNAGVDQPSQEFE